jgi:2-aminoadipate transaminase
VQTFGRESDPSVELARAAAAVGIAINPGHEWSPDKAYGRPRMRLCFGNPSRQTIREDVAALADICRREFGAPSRIANVERVSRA